MPGLGTIAWESVCIPTVHAYYLASQLNLPRSPQAMVAVYSFQLPSFWDKSTIDIYECSPGHELSVVKSHSYLLYSQSWYFCCLYLFCIQLIYVFVNFQPCLRFSIDKIYTTRWNSLASICDHMMLIMHVGEKPICQVNMSVYSHAAAVYSTSTCKKLAAVLALVLQENKYTWFTSYRVARKRWSSVPKLQIRQWIARCTIHNLLHAWHLRWSQKS